MMIAAVYALPFETRYAAASPMPNTTTHQIVKMSKPAKRNLYSLSDGTQCHEKTWGFGVVKRVDDFYEKVTVDFDGKRGHQMSFAYAAETLELVDESHILARRHNDPETLAAMRKSLIGVAREMAPLVFTPERLDQLRADLKGYRRRLLEGGEGEAAMHAHAALAMLEREENPAENPLLIAICFASLRLLLITLSGEARGEAEGEV